jgi:hypothetical protein
LQALGCVKAKLCVFIALKSEDNPEAANVRSSNFKRSELRRLIIAIDPTSTDTAVIIVAAAAKTRCSFLNQPIKV